MLLLFSAITKERQRNQNFSFYGSTVALGKGRCFGVQVGAWGARMGSECVVAVGYKIRGATLRYEKCVIKTRKTLLL